MSGDWQTWTALGIVALTAVLFVVRAVRRRRASKSGCPSAADCGCSGAKIGNPRPGGERR